MPGHDEILDQLAAAHRGVLAAGQAWLDQDKDRLRDEIDKAIAGLVAVGEMVGKHDPEQS